MLPSQITTMGSLNTVYLDLLLKAIQKLLDVKGFMIDVLLVQ